MLILSIIICAIIALIVAAVLGLLSSMVAWRSGAIQDDNDY